MRERQAIGSTRCTLKPGETDLGSQRFPPSALDVREAKPSRTFCSIGLRMDASVGIRSADTARPGRRTPPVKKPNGFWGGRKRR